MRWEDLSKEERLLLCCARKEIDKDSLLYIKKILASGVNWSNVLKTGGRQGILSFLYLHLKDEDGIQIPSWVRERLNDFYYRIVYRNMRIYALLKLILHKFHETGIPVVILKGVALADKVYGNIGLRPMYDIDLLVKKQDLDRVNNIISGLQCSPDLRSEEGKSYHNRYLNQDNTIGIEVHWDIENTANPFTLNIDEFWERTETEEIQGTQVLVFSPEDLILYLCLHTAYHHKFSQYLITLKQLCDITESISYYRNKFDWSQLNALARQYGLSKPVYCTLYIVENLFKAGIPLDEISALRSESFREDYADFIIKERIFARNPFPAGIVSALSGLGMSEKVKTFIKTVFLPPSVMVRRYFLNPASPKVYLYYFIRIYHLLFDYGGIVVKLFARHPKTISELQKEISVSKQQAEIDQWLESVT